MAAPLHSSWCEQTGFNALAAVRAELAAAGRTSDRPLIIGAGEGTTATRSLVDVLRRGFGLKALHWFGAGSSDENIARILGLLHATPELYSDLDFPQLFQKYDVVSDVPVPQLFPFIFAAFPNARVLHTVRDAMTWVEKRSTDKPDDIKPLAAMMSPIASVPHYSNMLKNHAELRAMRNRTAKGESFPSSPVRHANFNRDAGLRYTERRSSRFASAILYSAQNAYYRCITPRRQYMLVDAFAGDMCRDAFVPTLAAFINRTVRKEFLERPVIPGCKKDTAAGGTQQQQQQPAGGAQPPAPIARPPHGPAGTRQRANN